MHLCLGTTYIPICKQLEAVFGPHNGSCQIVTKVLARQMSWVAGPWGRLHSDLRRPLQIRVGTKPGASQDLEETSTGLSESRREESETWLSNI